MHRSPKRIVTPLFLLLVAAVLFAPEVRGDTLLNFTFGGNGGDTLSFTLPQNPVPDVVGIDAFGVTDDFEFIQVPVFTSFMPPNTPLTFNIFFGRDLGEFEVLMFCNPFIVSATAPPFFHCDFLSGGGVGNTPIWSGPLDNPTFIPGVYGDLTISATPEPSTLALLLMSFATLSLLAVRVRPSHHFAGLRRRY